MSVEASPFSDLVSPRVGVLRRVARISRGVTEPVPPILYQATLSHFDFRSAKPHERAGVGKAVTDSDAMNGAIAEALERYCASQPNMSLMRRFAWKDRSGDAISPVECCLYSESQYAGGRLPYKRWDEGREVPWIPACELPGGNSVWIPASLTFLDYPGNDRDTYFCSPTSNGLAAGRSLEAAILAGLYELIERDSFLICWMNRMPAIEIVIPGSAEVESSIVRHYERFNIDARVFRLPTDMPVHVMMGVLVGHTERGPAIVIGLGCHAEPRKAVRKALFETAQVHPSAVTRCMDPSYADRLKSYEDVRTLDDHGAFFTSPKRMNEFAFLFEDPRRTPERVPHDGTRSADVRSPAFELSTHVAERDRGLCALDELPDFSRGDVRADLDDAIAALRNAGCRVVYADLTTPDLRDYPIRVVRTIATGLQPIHFGYGEERLGGKRVFELPRILGYADRDLDESTLNRCPHPLP